MSSDLLLGDNITNVPNVPNVPNVSNVPNVVDNVYTQLSPMSTQWPVEVEGILYPSLLHATLLPFLHEEHQRSVLLSITHVHDMIRRYNEIERLQFEELVSSIVKDAYHLFLTPSSSVQVYDVGKALEALHRVPISPSDSHPSYENKYILTTSSSDGMSNMSIPLQPVIKDLFQQLKGVSIYFHEMWDPLEVIGLNGTKTPVEGLNVLGRTLESLSWKERRADEYESRATEIYYLHALLLYFEHLFQREGKMLWPFVGKRIQTIYEEFPDFREFLSTSLSFSMMDPVHKDKVVRSFFTKTHPETALLEMECAFPGNLAVFFMKKHIGHHITSLYQKWTSMILVEFSSSTTADYFPGISEEEIRVRTSKNILTLPHHEREKIYQVVSKAYDNGKWKSETLDRLREERKIADITAHELLQYNTPRVYNFVSPCVCLGDQLSNVKKDVFIQESTPSLPLFPMLYLLDYRSFILFSAKVKGSSRSFFFPSVFHYLYFRLFLAYGVRRLNVEEEEQRIMDAYGKIWIYGEIPPQVEENFSTEIPTDWQDPKHFVDSFTSVGHELLFSVLTEIIQDRKRQLMKVAMEKRVEQHPYLRRLLMTTSILGWSGFRYQSSLGDPFWGFVSEEREEDFFAWRQHNVLGRLYSSLRESIIQSHSFEYTSLQALASFIPPEKHSFDLFQSQYELMASYLTKSVEFSYLIPTPRVLLTDVMTFTRQFYPFLFRLDTMVAVRPTSEELERVANGWKEGLNLFSTDARDYVCRVWAQFWLRLNHKKVPQQALAPPPSESETMNSEGSLTFWMKWWSAFLSQLHTDHPTSMKHILTSKNLTKMLNLIFPEMKGHIPSGIMEIKPTGDCDDESLVADLMEKIRKLKKEYTPEDFICVKGKWFLKTSKTAMDWERNGPPASTVVYLFAPLFQSKEPREQLRTMFPFIKKEEELARVSFVMYHSVRLSTPLIISFLS